MISRKKSFAAEQMQLRKGKKKIMFLIMAGVLAALIAIAGYIAYSQRTSSFAFKGQTIDIRDIGRKLNVETVLEGSVRKADNRLRITTQLVKVDDGFHLWSETFDREFGDIFAIQEEISLAIVDALKGRVLESERASLGKMYTGNPEAYEQYLLAMNILKSWSDSTTSIEKENKKAYEHLRSAIDRDPDFALAYTGLAYFYIFNVWEGYLSPDEGYKKARENVEKAMAIDSDLAEAHSMKAMIHTYYDWDWYAAEQSYKKALVMMNIHRRLGNYEKMKDFFHRGLAISPGFQLGYRVMGHYYLSRGDYHNALEQFLKIDEIVPGWIVTEAWIAYTCARLGEREKAEAILQKWLERSRKEFVPSLPIASIYMCTMALITMNWDLPTGEKYDTYIDDVFFTDEERTAWIPRMLKQPGAVELRAFRNTLRTTPQVLVLYEMDSLESCVGFLKTKEYAMFMDELRSDGCTNISVHLWGPSPLIPEPMKP